VSILDEVGEYVIASSNTCTVAAWLAEHPDYSSAQLAEAASVHSKTAVWKFMKARGFGYGSSPVERHLNGECKCR